MSDCFYLFIIVFNLYIFISLSMKEGAFCSFCAVFDHLCQEDFPSCLILFYVPHNKISFSCNKADIRLWKIF